MSMLATGPVSAVAFQLAATLEDYEREVEQLAAARGDAELYARVSERMDCMRRCAASLPQVSVPWVEVLIGHFEFTHCLWRALGTQDDAGELAACGQLQCDAARRLHRHCVRKYLAAA